ncbi:N-6 DNA methylase [Candidatus Pacearchaeota archaeon]|nr:N-6 DNA methylase [Candidatus Pacearchaeota archaeon]
MSVGNIIQSIRNIMRRDEGVDGDAQRISQIVWMIFLKVFDAMDGDEETKAAIENKKYKSVIPDYLKWRNWAQDSEGITGEDLSIFINNVLFPELKKLKSKKDRKAYLVGGVFEDTYNYMKNGVLIRQVINKINEIDFATKEDRHTFNDIYESILKELQNAGSSGEFYTPRPVTQFIVDMINPRLGEKVMDPACGTGGFLICASDHLEKQVKSIEDRELKNNSILGTEKKPLPHLLCTTNLILHGIETPNITHGNSLGKPLRDYNAGDAIDCFITNPPFGGAEELGIEKNFPTEFQTRETADLFMALIMKRLKDGGRCGLVLPDGFLFGEGVKTRIKEKLLKEFNLHTIVRLPNGVFAPYTGIRTNLLFFTKGKTTKDIWYFEHKLPEGYKTYNKTKPMRIEEFDIEKKWWNNRVENEYAWKVSFEDIVKRNYNLDINNPRAREEDEVLSSNEILEKLEKSFGESSELLNKIKGAI